ncbi:OpgC domain-containing protein [Modestobacter sp. VKM Ac-2977]|uniref:OpgC domain-containing protein n=1 Tax=Modestobacter sp. VKM Ac-2977 TaxID=3004131 RepID=UPI0022AA425A|nr:OpgC domain-containing protein [Modestobacter sp. VKM Ac-2977]MCZ2822749.1 OpgC domain-containing protein [Modestobacter sp. VKM Ac-2977]
MIGRDLSLDLIRGLCVVSMTASHLAHHSVFDRATHPSPWVDGASGFVLVSGVLVGVVQRRLGDRGDTAAAREKLLRRVWVIYLGHVLLAALALGLAAADPEGAERLPHPDDQGGWVAALAAAVTLRVNPPNASILGLYVIVMLLSLGTVALLRKGWWPVAAGYAAAVYALGFIDPAWVHLPREAGTPLDLSWAAWFGLFTLGLLAGWWWADVRSALTQGWVPITLAIVTVIGVLAARADLGSLSDELVDKDVIGPVRILVSVTLWAFVYVVADRAARIPSLAALVAPVSLIGKRGLDSYLILSVLVLVLPSLWTYEQGSPIGVLVALASLCACLAWAGLRTRPGLRARQGRRRLRAAARS